MKFYLSSYHIPTPHDLFELVGKDPSYIKVGLIANAKDYYAPRARTFKVGQMTDYLTSLGLSVSEVDLRTYSDAEILKTDLSNFDLLWVAGGNAFCLRYEMKRSGFESIIGLVLDAGVVYGGDSAGAVVIGNSLKGIELADQSEFAEEIILDGIGLVSHFILPHVDSSDIGETIDQTAVSHTDDATMIKLTDTEALIIDGRNQRVSKSIT